MDTLFKSRNTVTFKSKVGSIIPEKIDKMEHKMTKSKAGYMYPEDFYPKKEKKKFTEK